MMSRTLTWAGLAVAALALLIAGSVALLDASRLRGALTHFITGHTGRQLTINGDVQWKLDWPQVRLQARDVTFANPPWARQANMLTATAVDLSVDLPRILRGTVFLPEVHLEHPVVLFERDADGRKNWLLDQDQREESARVMIGRLTLDDGRVGYDDPKQKTSIVVEVSTRRASPNPAPAGASDAGITFKARGTYLGLPLAASGDGGAVVALRDERTPYPLTIAATVGPTSVRAKGTITGLIAQSALDMELALRGASLAELFDVLGIPLPETHAYALAGRFIHGAQRWRYEEFTGKIGKSDVRGTLTLDKGVARPLLTGELAFKSLDLADLGPVVGEQGAAQPGHTSLRGPQAARTADAGSRALPARPFRRDHWTTVDADVQVKAQTILRPKALPLELFTTRLRMRESVLTLDPLDFGAAGGHLVGVIRLDGQHTPIRASARINVNNLRLAKLLPTVALAQSSVGNIDGTIELAGRGDSIARMLATADGKIGLVVEGGKVSKLLMEQIAMHVPETIMQRIAGDELVDIRCGVADFNVEHGMMNVGVLVLDTDVTKVVGHGGINLENEALDMTLVPRPKHMSLFALRGPIHVGGGMAHPVVSVDTGRAVVRGLAAAALAAINPALSLFALMDPGSGKDSDCAALTKRVQAPWRESAVTEKHAPATAPQEKGADAAPARRAAGAAGVGG